MSQKGWTKGGAENLHIDFLTGGASPQVCSIPPLSLFLLIFYSIYHVNLFDGFSLLCGIPKIADHLASSDAFMANTDQQTILLSESNSKEEVKVSVAHAEGRAGPSSATASEEVNKDSETPSTTSSSVASKASTSPTSTSTSTAETRPANAPTRPTLVQLGSSSTQPSSTAPHPHKKFNAVNINKKFLEKNSAAAMATASSASTAGKSIHSMCKPSYSISFPPLPRSLASVLTMWGNISETARPQIQTTQSHSRLVTAKLTGSPAPSSTTGPGWSRPTSTAPSSTGTSSPIGSSPLPAAAVAVSINSGAPQLPHVGKVIQPQPRAAVLQTTNLQKEGVKSSVKPAWANVRPPVVGPIMTSEDFPTAAEVAKGTLVAVAEMLLPRFHTVSI